jgi:hypothetical protein
MEGLNLKRNKVALKYTIVYLVEEFFMLRMALFFCQLHILNFMEHYNAVCEILIIFLYCIFCVM